MLYVGVRAVKLIGDFILGMAITEKCYSLLVAQPEFCYSRLC
uniref:Peptidylprolyl isomerase n=1 Tax=Rhizophora mucronata TaxID=61149 RepID=A0A2P2QGF7_RHIMU